MYPHRFAFVVVLAIGASPLLTAALVAVDPPTKHSITFQTLPGKPSDKVEYKLTLIVELHGNAEEFMSRDNKADGGLSGDALAGFLAGQMKQAGGWKYAVTGNTLVIDGWTDPTTKTIHPTKRIRFESPNLPKASFPTVSPRKA